MTQMYQLVECPERVVLYPIDGIECESHTIGARVPYPTACPRLNPNLCVRRSLEVNAAATNLGTDGCS